MQIRVKNLNKGQRGVYVNGELAFVDGHATSTFTGATAQERDVAAAMHGLKVQSRLKDGDGWTDHFEEEMPEEKPWIAYATDDKGTGFTPINAHAWYVGMAVAGERPDGAAGYTWHKVGGSMEAQPEPEAAPANTDYSELVKSNATDVIAAITADNAAAIGAAEKAREGGPRQGVLNAVDKASA